MGIETPHRSVTSPQLSRHTPLPVQPPTPTIVPPTPGPASMITPAKPPAPSPSSSSYDLFYETEDSERQTNRRSMYRSPGTSSSPDLATLVRKARERGTVLPAHHKRDKRRESPPPPLPTGAPSNSTTVRQRPSTGGSANAYSPLTTPLRNGNAKQSSRGLFDSSSTSDWVLTSPRETRESGPTKPKQSVRAKTTAFLGKMLGQGTMRERSKTDASQTSGVSNSSSYSNSLFEAFTPPVPPIPAEHQRQLPPPTPSTVPSNSPIADAFSTTKRASAGTSKPLPPIMGNQSVRGSDDTDARSMVFVEKESIPPPSAAATKSNNYGKRRSMSVSDVELKKALANVSMQTPLPPRPDPPRKENPSTRSEDAGLNGIINDFRGELSQLDPISGSSLELKDPCTPARREQLWSNKSEVALPSIASQGHQPYKKRRPTSSQPTTPTLTLQLPSQTNGEDVVEKDGASSPLPSPIVPPRTSSLQTSIRSASGPTSLGSPRTQGMRNSVSPLRSRSGPTAALNPHASRDASLLRVLHRPTASNSEPSLIPNEDVARSRELSRTRSIRLVPSTNTLQSSTLVSQHTASQQDLTLNDLTLSRFSSNQTRVEDEGGDIESRGKEMARRCYEEDEEFLAKEKIAEWLGGNGVINKVALRHYVDFYDFSGLRLDMAFRRLCAKLYLKGETQQVDRILEEFSRRYWDCNPGSLYGSANIVHAVSYSLLLLNTDLHVAELTTRMSRSQFVRNTLTAIQMQIQPTTPAQKSSSDLTYDDTSSVRGGVSEGADNTVRSKRSDSITSWNSVSRDALMSPNAGQSKPPDTIHSNGSTPSVQNSTGQEKPRAPANSPLYGKSWEADMEALLKEMYNAIKSQQILQPLSASMTRPSTSSIGGRGGILMRNRSLRGPPDRLTTFKRGSILGIQTLMNAQTGPSPYSSNSSIDGRVSPSPSFATSTNEALYGTNPAFSAPAIGFVRNLTHTIIRETQEDDDRSVRSADSSSTTISITDEELALLGPPWAKEGMLCRKHYWESVGKRAKDKAWLDVFVVIAKGELNMFTFGESHTGTTGAVGGGNWLSNATPAGTVHLAHTLAHALHPPGYSRQRPHCMVLTLANNGAYFFQAGTEELVNEWVQTCNYWAARTSKEPLMGGVSNMEYGWNRISEPQNHGSDDETDKATDYTDSMSIRSTKSNRSRFGRRDRDGASSMRSPHSPWAERVYINDWKAPLPPTVASTHDEETQLEALKKHVIALKDELEKHNTYREPMMALYPPRSENCRKAQINWENKSQWLLTEIVKYESYIDSLQAAMTLRLKKRGEKALERALNGAPPIDELLPAKPKWKGPEGETIREEVEPNTPGVQSFGSKLHRRETAESGQNVDDENDD
ncbi:hypothetical protein AX16_002040 [Volvariella volvacea WC 439]|nr:hypothetical protein AX16_002040 [Volvariella volvacea WC 439]